MTGLQDHDTEQVTAEQLEGQHFCYPIECDSCGAEIAGETENDAVGQGDALPITANGQPLCHNHSEDAVFVASGVYNHGGGTPCDSNRAFLPRDVVQVQKPQKDIEASIRLKVVIRHDPRNQGVSVSRAEERLKTMINHPNERITDIRISVGRESSSIIIGLHQKRWWGQSKIEDLVREIPWQLEKDLYADNISLAEWLMSAEVSQEEDND